MHGKTKEKSTDGGLGIARGKYPRFEIVVRLILSI